MGRVRGFLFLGGIVLIIGPMFGVTLRGLGGLTQGQSAILGGVFLVVAFLMGKLGSTSVPRTVPARVTTQEQNENQGL